MGAIISTTASAKTNGLPLDFGTLRPPQVIERATEIATTLGELIARRKLFVDLEGKQYVVVEAWTTLAAMLGIVPREVETVQTREGYTSTVELIRTRDGAVVGRASAYCGTDELLWQRRPVFARRSMAITRATSKACRIAFSWIITLAGYEPTPAEEMDHVDPPRQDSLDMEVVHRFINNAATLERLEQVTRKLRTRYHRSDIPERDWLAITAAIGDKAFSLAVESIRQADTRQEVDSICTAAEKLGVDRHQREQLRAGRNGAERLRAVKDDAAMQKWRATVAQECMFCGVSEEKAAFGLSVHHVIKRSRLRLDVPWNFLLLCQPCHQRCEGEIVVVDGSRLSPVPFAEQLWLKWRKDRKNYRRDLLHQAYGPGLPRSKRPDGANRHNKTRPAGVAQSTNHRSARHPTEAHAHGA